MTPRKWRALTWPIAASRKNRDFRSWLIYLKTLADDGHDLPKSPERTPVVY